ncbi:MAG: hypothetical protein JRC93_08605 [Deltaproteobacteria bacterium]|nr:hypothetical protein [Deltaproteobacteria bacterium]
MPINNNVIIGRIKLTGFILWSLIAVAAWFAAERVKNTNIAVTMVASAYRPQSNIKTSRAVKVLARLFNPD